MASTMKESEPLVPESSFAEVKSHFSKWMTEVVQGRRPLVVDRNRGRERAVLVDLRDLSLALEPFRFSPQVEVSGGEFVLRLPEFNLIAGGSDLDEALEELEELAEVYVEDYLDRVSFYLETDRRRQLPWVLRFALTPQPQRRALLDPQLEQLAEVSPER